jgi:hypothetical protein
MGGKQLLAHFMISSRIVPWGHINSVKSGLTFTRAIGAWRKFGVVLLFQRKETM